MTVFLKVTQLKHLVHVSEAMITDVVHFMESCVADFKSPIAALAVDNAANSVSRWPK